MVLRREREIVCAYLWSSDGKLLLGKRGESASRVYPGRWLAPGGGVEAGETHMEALARELMEEIGFSLAGLAVTLIDDRGASVTERTNDAGELEQISMRFYVFDVRVPKVAADMPIVPLEEFEEVRWFTGEELAELPMAPAGVELLTRLGALVKK